MINNENFQINANTGNSDYVLERCECCTIYPCDIVKQYLQLVKNYSNKALPQYIKDDMESRCNTEHCRIECKAGNVFEGVKDHYNIEIDNYTYKIIDAKRKWSVEEPVFISAQTGFGKSYFSETVLHDYIRNLNINKRTEFRILILCSRIALKMQTDTRIKDDEIINFEEYIDVMTYQSLLNKSDFLKKIQKEKNQDMFS